MIRLWMAAGAALALAGCGAGAEQAGGNGSTTANEASPAGPETAEAGTAAPAAAGGGGMPACPFRETRNLAASVEGGRVLVTGNVDFLMAGFKPTLSPRDNSSPPVLRLDLILAPEPGGAVDDTLRYQAPVGGGYKRLEVFCGGELVQSLDMTVI